MSALRVVGVDPGLTRCGVGVVDVTSDRRARLVHVEVIRTPSQDPPERRLHALARSLDALLSDHQPDTMAVESVFAQQNRRTVMGTAQASGVALLVAGHKGIPAFTHTPTEVKAAVTGYGAADKRQVQAMVARILRLPVAPSPADAADALALAICHAWRRPHGAPLWGEGRTPAQQAWHDAERARGGAR